MDQKNAPPPPYPGGYPPQQPGYPQQQAYPQQPNPYPQQPGYGAPSPYPVQGYPQPAMSHNTTIITQPQQMVMLPVAFGEFPVSMNCPHCRAQIVSATCYDTGSMTWVVAGVLFLVGCWPCCLIPFCVDGCKDVTHSCPNCQRILGVYHRM